MDTMERVSEEESLHSHCDCSKGDLSHDPHRLPRPPDDVHFNVGNENGSDTDYSIDDDDDSDREDLKPLKNTDSPIRILQQGRIIVPHYPPPMPLYGNDALAACRSQGNVGMQINHQPASNLIWIGSSLNTMHQVPIVKKTSKQMNRSHTSFSDIQRSPSILSKKMASSRYSSVTVSECGTDMISICRICQMAGDDRDPLISPCRCCGSLRYVHTSCLKKWVRISQRRGRKQPPRCELCHYQFMRHKQFKFSQWKWPRVRPRDKCLHIIFLLNLLIMVGCAIATIMCFLSDRDNAAKFPKNKVKLTSEEVITLTCGVMFFVAFFIAMTVEIKARHTLYKLFLRFIMHNTEWTVEQYERSKDTMFKRNLTASQV